MKAGRTWSTGCALRYRRRNMSIALEDIVSRITDYYGFDGELISCSPFGNGHINDTFLLVYTLGNGENRYVLQKINKYVFHHPDELMENGVAVTAHLRKKVVEAGGDPEREVLRFVPAKNGLYYYLDDDEEYWRISCFIDNTISRDTASSPEDLYTTGLAFGHFQSLLSDYPANTLYETIPGFHDTRSRFERFKTVVARDVACRAESCKEEIAFILDRESIARYSMDSYDRGEIPLRVTHNDTKLNNLLIDKNTEKALCVIDLDTVMPGFSMNDFGDAIRSGACTAAEDELDLIKVHCDLAFYEAFTKGFIEGCAGKLTPHEIEILPMGALGITYEQAIRFLTDYLEGDVYYKTSYDLHNLVRTRTQIKMVLEMEEKWDEICSMIRRYC